MSESFFRLRPGNSPARFVFVDPDTRRVFEAPSYKALAEHVTSYRLQNELEAIRYLPQVIEDFWCRLPENMGKCQPMKLPRNLTTIVKGGVTLLWKKITGGFVDETIANYRGRICSKCPFNVFPDKGPFLKWQDDAALVLTGKSPAELKKISTYHEQLGNCAVCTCNLKAKIWVTGPFDPSSEEQEKMRTVQCWQLEELK